MNKTSGQIVGYARVSSIDQNLDIQVSALQAAGCSKIFKEKLSGVHIGRPEYQNCIEYLRNGDILTITRIDRLARNAAELLRLLEQFQQEGIGLRVLEQDIDTTTTTGKAFFQMLAIFAEFETNLRRERQMEGILKAKQKGKSHGRPRKLSDSQIQYLGSLRASGLSMDKIAAKMQISKGLVHKTLQQLKASEN